MADSPEHAEIIAALQRCRVFEHLSAESLALLAPHARRVDFDRRQPIFAQGDECPGLYAVLRGVVRVFKVSADGKDHVLHFAEPGSTFAEVAAIAGFPLPAHAEALEDCQCLLLPAGPLRALLLQDHALCRELLVGLSRWVRQLVGHLEDIALRDAAGRLARYLVGQRPTAGNRLRLRMPKHELASHLNLTSETLSRTLRRFADAGLIAVDDESIELLRTDALQQVAQGLLPAEFAG